MADSSTPPKPPVETETSVPEATTAAPAEATTTTTTAEATTEVTTDAAASPAAGESSAPAATDILPASYWAQRAEEDSDSDSAYAESIISSTASLSASILEYRTLHGRTFHSERGDAQSWNPNDEAHDEAMDILHHASTLMMDGKIYLAELEQDEHIKVLDVGCGTGIWAIDFADQHPQAEVIGVDISPQQPAWIPPNLKFEVDDVTQEWTYAPNSFDYIHMRWLVGSIADWTALYKEIFKALKPGGTFEHKESSAMIQSSDGTVAQGSALDQWGRVFWEAGKKFGRSFRVVEDHVQEEALKAAGFVDVKVTDIKCPIGTWPADKKNKDIGRYAQLALQRDVEGFVVFMWSSVMGWTKEEIQVYAAHLRKEMRSGKSHAWYPQRVVVATKPLTA